MNGERGASEERRAISGRLTSTERLRTGLERVRTEPRVRVPALIVFVTLGLTLTWIHWFGLLIGGALVGIVSKSLLRALIAGLLFGLVVLLAFVLTLGEAAGAVLEMWPAVGVTVSAALGLPILGSLVRGIV